MPSKMIFGICLNSYEVYDKSAHYDKEIVTRYTLQIYQLLQLSSPITTNDTPAGLRTSQSPVGQPRPPDSISPQSCSVISTCRRRQRCFGPVFRALRACECCDHRHSCFDSLLQNSCAFFEADPRTTCWTSSSNSLVSSFGWLCCEHL